MSIAELQIHNLRNIHSASLTLHPQLNFLSGPNGSGKTSFLEAIYLLGTGHSFRTREISPLVSHDQERLVIFARTDQSETVSIQKSVSLPTVVRINNLPCLSSSELARFLPCQVFYQDIFQIVDAGPSVRRGLLDWGLFHVKQCYHPIWKDYRKALRHRNCLLRDKAAYAQILPWDKTLSELGEQINVLRQDYFRALVDEFTAALNQLTEIPCTLTYYKGWDRRQTNKSLDAILHDSYQADLQRQFTQYGPHQADLLITSSALKAKQCLSRGQQKIILIALKMAQANLLQQNCCYLCDDLTVELDADHIKRLMKFIQSSKGQFFMTTIDLDALAPEITSQAAYFKANHGEIESIN